MDPCKNPKRLRSRLGLDDEPIVAAMAGGGADGFALMQTFVDAVRLLRCGTRRFAAILVTGPFMPDARRKQLRDQARTLAIHVQASVGDGMSHINAADVVVTMAGYNTLIETMRFQKKAIVVPRPGPSAEQTMRAGLFEQRGLLRTLEPSRLSPQGLAAEIDLALATPGSTRARLPGLDGVARATEILLGWLPRAERPEVTTPAVAAAPLPAQVH
jgi:predicted glycosyltransferase